jgi:acetyl-CoA carboxylase biotin carboxyl carrier protein
MSATFDPEQVRALAQILADTGLTEIEIEGSAGRIRVARAHPPAAMAAPSPSSVTVLPAPAAAPAAMAAPTPEEDAKHPGAVLSPMVGIAYLSPEPGSPPFVQLGQEVSAGQTVLLIEAMKTFNQIKAPKAGTVRRILVTPGTPVEYGEPLLILE